MEPDSHIPHNRAKIIATLGPASEDADVLAAMIKAGVSVVRLNMSHGSHETHQKNIETIRAVSKKLNRSIGILADLQGPKLRTGVMKDDTPVELEKGSTVSFKACDEPSTAEQITTPSRQLIATLEQDALILINDGHLRLKVNEIVSPEEVRCSVLQGGRLSERKGINVPNTSLSFQALTEKDKADALFAVDNGADYLALSFVRCAEDVQSLQDFIAANDRPVPPIIAKIEKPQALEDLDRILEAAFGLMVARGDLGVELPPQQVPIAQKHIIERCTAREKPVIVATQMLESMMDSVHPSRAEVSDIANAIFDGADVVMLSGETAMGKNPIQSVDMMRQIIVEAEIHFTSLQSRPHEASSIHSPHFHHTIAHAASYASIKANVKAIVVLSSSGKMAQRISKLKPHRRIIALTEDEHTCNRMSLLWGVTPLLIEFGDTTEEIINRGEEEILKKKLLAIGDNVLFCAGNTPVLGASNMLKFLKIGEAVRSAIGIL